MGISKEDWADLKKDVKDLVKSQAEINQYLKDQKPICDKHTNDISSLKTFRNILSGAYLGLVAFLKIKKDL
jgi:hypothetical protein